MTNNENKQKTEEKVKKSMNNSAVAEPQEDFASLYQNSLKEIKEDKVVKGYVVGVTDKDVLVDIGYKSEGIIPKEEFGRRPIEQGMEIDVYVEEIEDEDGMIGLSKAKADKILGWEKTIAKYEEGDEVEGHVVRKVKGGLMVDIGMEAFLPASQIDIKPLKELNLDEYLDQSFNFKILKINAERKNIVVSRRELLENHRKIDKTRLLSEIEEGQVRTGFVKNITDFGAFIDLNGMDGLLHITDMTWGRISHPSELLSMGQSIDVMILKFDREKERVSLGLKQMSKNPWEDISEKYPKGNKVKGKVVNIMPYGAFVEIEKGVEGLIHISEMSWTKKITDPSEVTKVGDEVEVIVLEIDSEHKKLSLGMKQIDGNPWDQVNEKYPIGSQVKGLIRSITNYGIFLELEEGVDGMVHISDISWNKNFNHPNEVYKTGEEVEAVVLDLDLENKKIALGIKQLQEDPWSEIEAKFKADDIVEGKVTKSKQFGVFVELGDGVEGLIHLTQLTAEPIESAENYIPVDEVVRAKILKVDPEEKKIALTLLFKEDETES